MNGNARLMLTLRKEIVIKGCSHDLKSMFPLYKSCAYNKTKIVNELKSEVNWKTFEVGVFSRGVSINQFQVLFTCIYKLL